jgi:6-phosphofructokinase 1
MTSGKSNLVVAQSGGPTVAINSTLVGVIQEALEHDAIDGIYGARHGITGVLEEDLTDLRKVPAETLEGLRRTPAAALGTVRHKLTDADYDRLLEVFRAYNIRYFFYIGGNDSMDTANRVHKMASEVNYEMAAFGVPKTVDNDLAGTDHCPGYGSAARFVAMAIRDTGMDTEAMGASSPVKIMEIMGRNAGWLTASSILARQDPDDAPHLVYVPERPISTEMLLSEVEAVHRRLGRVVIALSEGATDEKGEPLGSGWQTTEVDVFGHRMKGGTADGVSQLITQELGLKARMDKPNYLQRSFMLCASEVDLAEAYEVGRAAVRAAVAGESGKMIALLRVSSDPYEWKTGTVPLSEVANVEKPLADQYIDRATGQITSAFVDYAKPLIGGPFIPYARIAHHPIERP